MKTLLLTGSALVLMSGVALAQTPKPVAPTNHQMNAQMGAAAAHVGSGAVPYGVSAKTYLEIASQAVQSRQKARAHVALGRAETNLLTNSYIQGTVNGPISTPAVSAVREARQAVEQGNYERASSLIRKAMTEVNGSMESGAGMGSHAMTGQEGQMGTSGSDMAPSGTMSGQATGSMKSNGSM